MEIDIGQLQKRSRCSRFWMSYFSENLFDLEPFGIHLAVFSEPYLSLIFSGHKILDARLSKNRCEPYGEIDSGDVILIKEVGGPVCGLALANSVHFYDFRLRTLHELRLTHGDDICASDDFWDLHHDANYGTLIELSEVSRIPPWEFEKRDRRGWVSLRKRQLKMVL